MLATKFKILLKHYVGQENTSVSQTQPLSHPLTMSNVVDYTEISCFEK